MNPTVTEAPRFQVSLLNERPLVIPTAEKAKPKPVFTYRDGPIEIPIFKVKSGHYIKYRIKARLPGSSKREFRSSLPAAKKRAEDIARDIINGETAMAGFTQDARASHLRCCELALPTGKPPELLVAQAVEAEAILSGRISMVEAAKDWLRRNPVGLVSKKSAELLKEFLEKRQCGKKWRRMVTQMLTRFTGHFTGTLDVLTTRELEDWLDSLKSSRKKKTDQPISLRTRRNYLSAIRELANFAISRGYLAADWNTLDQVQDPDPPMVDVSLYTPDELVRLLNKADTYKAGRKLVPLIAITAFAGVRHGEMNEEKIEHLDWADFDWEAKRILIDAGAAKNTRRNVGDGRAVDMPDNLIAWLEPYRRPHGKLCELVNTSSALCRLRKKAGITGRKRNALRKSFITYKLAKSGDIERTADQAGNSPGMIRKNYKGAVHTRLREVADRWFSIMPTRADVLPLFKWAAAK